MSLQDESRHKMVTDAINKHFKDPEPRREEKIANDLKFLNNAVMLHIKPILKAGGGFDREALQSTIATLFQQGFEKFSKDELILMLTGYHVVIAMGIVDASPTGSSPDLLSGV
jgi:predicted XRE-type DNA-binding protein